MKMLTVTGIIALAVGAMGCSSTWQAAAPAQNPNYEYVVGAEAGFFGSEPVIWLCPTNAGEEAECQIVEVVE